MVATIQKAIIFPQFPHAPPKLRKHDSKIYAHKSWQRKITSNIDAGFNYSVNRALRRLALSLQFVFAFAPAAEAYFNAGASVSGASEFQHLRKKLASRMMTRILFTACAPKVQSEREKGRAARGVRHVLEPRAAAAHACVENVSTRQTHV